VGESSWDMMLTTSFHLGSWLRVSGALRLILPYAFMILTRTSPHSSQLYVVDLMVVFNVIDIGFSSLFYWQFMDISLDLMKSTKYLSLFLRWRKLFPADVAVW
jgi:hypothetical protein